ncbi:MAG: HAD domain-containing protein [Solirubrobacterales bacterium]
MQSTQRPILAVAFDGVISLFGFAEGLDQAPGEMKLIDGMVHCISLAAGERLRRLAESYELVWATGWEERANDHLPSMLGLAERIPVLTFDGRASFGTAHWKVDAIDEYAGERPLAWIDDNLDDTCTAWAESRAAPTLLVPTESDRGLEEGHVAALLDWVAASFEPR